MFLLTIKCPSIPAGSTIQPPAGASETVQLGKRKPGKRSHGSSQAYKHRRKERKLAHKKASKPSKIAGLQARVQHLGQTVVVPTFSIIRDVNVTTTGWQGLPPPASSSKDIIKRWKNGSIKEDIGKNFLPLPYLGDEWVHMFTDALLYLTFYAVSLLPSRSLTRMAGCSCTELFLPHSFKRVWKSLQESISYLLAPPWRIQSFRRNIGMVTEVVIYLASLGTGGNPAR